MFKNSFKQVLKFILVMFFGLSFTTSALATTDQYGSIIDNNTFDTAYPMGYWQYHGSTICKLKADKNEAYFSFTANTKDRVYASVALSQELLNTGARIDIYNTSSQTRPINTGVNVVNSTYSSFIFANADATTNSQTFYIKVTRGSAVGDILFPVRIENRISTGLAKFDFVGTASNPGNPNILTNPNGVDSSIITMDLTNKSTIPVGAIVKSITTSGTISPSKGGILHKISSNENNIWHTATVKGSGYNINVSNALKVKQNWSFRYNQKATGASTMKNVKANINYEYDITEGF